MTTTALAAFVALAVANILVLLFDAGLLLTGRATITERVRLGGWGTVVGAAAVAWQAAAGVALALHLWG